MKGLSDAMTFYFLYLFLVYCREVDLHFYVCMLHIGLVPAEIRRWHQISRNWSHRHL